MKNKTLSTLSRLVLLLSLLGLLGGCDDEASISNNTPDTTDTSGDVDPCGCAVDQTCVSNNTVTDACFPLSCGDVACGVDEVCFGGACVSESCAGLDCGGAPNICLAGACVVGSCDAGEVECSASQVCVNDACIDSCASQSDCSPMACINDYCQPCSDSAQCGDGLVCNIDQCVASCADDPNTCSADEFCHPLTGLCADRCTSDDFCEGAQICDATTGQCGEPECTTSGAQAECGPGNICLNGRCDALNPSFSGSFATGAAEMSSPTHRLIGVVAPVEIVGDSNETSSSTHRLEPGMIKILSAD